MYLENTGLTVMLSINLSFRQLRSIYVFSYFPFGFEGRMWNLIVSVPDHCLSFYFTSHYNYTLKVVLTDWDNVTKYAVHDIFRIADEADGYHLALGAYRNTHSAGDSLSRHNEMQFSTRDRDNDDADSNCAESHTDAW